MAGASWALETSPRRRLRNAAARLALAVVALALGTSAFAQAAAPADSLTVDALKRRLESVDRRVGLEASAQAKVVENYNAAIAQMQIAAALRAETADLKRRLEEAPVEIQQLESQLRSLENTTPTTLPALGAKLPLVAIEQMEAKARADDRQAVAQREALERAFQDAIVRPLELRRLQAPLRRELAQAPALRDPQASLEAGAAAVAESEQILAQARAAAWQARLDRFEQELVYQPALLRILQLRRDIARAEARTRRAEALVLESAVQERLREEVKREREEAAQAREAAVEKSDPVAAVAAQNGELRARLAEVRLSLNQSDGTLSARRQSAARVDLILREVADRRAEESPGTDFADKLIADMRSLPRADEFAEQRTKRGEAQAREVAALSNVQRDLAQLENLDAAVSRVMVASSVANRPPESKTAIEREVRRELEAQRGLLERLNTQQTTLNGTLQEIDDVETDLLERARAARLEIVRLLYWVSISPISAQTFADLPHAIAWLAEPSQWRIVARSLTTKTERRQALAIAVALVVAGLLVLRRRLRRRLAALSPRAIGFSRFRARHTLAALGVSLLLALPIPLLLFGAGRWILGAPGITPLGESLSAALGFCGMNLLAALCFVWLLIPGGVAIDHFNWSTEAARVARRGTRWLLVMYIPLTFIAVLASAYVPESVRQSVGRLSFIAAMIVFSLFWTRAFRPHLSFVRRAPEPGPRDFARALLRRGVRLFPLGIAVLAAAGFYFAAASLYQLVLMTILICFGAAVVYALLLLWLALQRAQLAEVEARAETIAERRDETSAEGAAVRVDTIDAEAIDAQTRELLNMVVALGLGIALWMLWRGAIPAFETMGNWALWTYGETVDGKTVERSVTLGGVFLATLVVVVAYFATKNIGGMLDIILLRRLQLQADANYAIKTVTRYVIAGIGIAVATQLIGVNWGRAQWLVAALGVGLGFGLQEIVANFVSGLIVLGERPIRIGDIVTVGEVSGTVTRIRARATVVTDWDNKEVMIPNKAFITERVTNWTLSSGVTRVLIKVGVAYGTDPERVRQILLDVVRSQPNVLAEPSPSVFFMAFGDSSLDFEIRAYVDGIGKRLASTNDLNIAIAKAFAENGIEIPFPQRDLHLRSAEGLQPWLSPAAGTPPPG